MHIKSITICGFKSYKKKVHLELSPGHNVIVGSNGSGKSNIYSALEFVLSSKYDLLRSEQRKQLLHDAGQSGVVSAYVEIIFDNSDQRFPLNEPLICIKRTIGAKKDEYFVNQKHKDKKEFNNFLESAGISKFNQHFIVPQGQIAQRVKERDDERLQLIKEIAGTRIYDTKRTESNKLLDEATNKREKVEQVINYFDNRLNELKSEKEELSKFEKLDRLRRSIEFSIYDKEKKSTQTQLDKLQENEGKTDEKNEKLHDELKKIKQELIKQNNERDGINKKLEKVNKTIKTKRRELQKWEKSIVTLSTKIKAMQVDKDEYNGKKGKYEKQLKELNGKIKTTKEELITITTKYETMKKKDDELRMKLEENNAMINDLYGKQERLGQYSSKTERNKDLQKKINEAKQEIEEQEKLCNDISKQNEIIDNKMEKYGKDLKKLQKSQKEIEKNYAKNEKNKEKLKKERSKLQNNRKILWKEKNEFDKLKDELRSKQEQNKKEFQHTMNYSMYKSYTKLKEIQNDIEKYGQDSRYKLSGKLYGAVIENFTVEREKYNIAVEAAAGNKLFYYIVENDVVAAELIEIMKREKINRVTFIPLNKCMIYKRRKNFQGAADVLPVMKLLNFDDTIENLENALLQIFGNTLIPKDIDVAFDYATRENYQCVTLNGDIVTSGGAMDGGFNDNKYRRLKYFSLIKNIQNQIIENEDNLNENNEKLKNIENRLLDIENKIRSNDEEINKFRNNLALYKDKLIDIEENMEEEDNMKSNKLNLLNKHEANINRIQITIDSLQKEMKQSLKTKLSNAEEEKLKNLKLEKEELIKQISSSVESISQVETEMNGINSILKDNLLPQQKELLNHIKKCNESGDIEQRLDFINNKLQIETESRDKLSLEIEENDKNIDSWNLRLKVLTKEINELIEQEQELLIEIEEHSIDSERLVGKHQALQEKLNQFSKYIRDLGALSVTDINKYKNKSMDNLNKQLKKIKKDLIKYKNVNKKALDQYNSFLKEKNKLNQRNQQQKEDKNEIEKLMKHLDNKKDEAIQKTFRAINVKFKESFVQLTRRGDAKLKLYLRKDTNNNDTNNDDDDNDYSQQQQSQQRGLTTRQRRRRRSSNMRGQRGRHNRNRRKSSLMSQQSQQFIDDELDDMKYSGVGIRVSFNGESQQIGSESEQDGGEGEGERARDMRQLSGGQQTVVALSLIFAIQECDPSPFYVFDEIDAALDQQYRKAVADIIASRKNKTQFITTTFRPEILQEADKCFVVDFKAKISTIKEVDPAEVDITQFT